MPAGRVRCGPDLAGSHFCVGDYFLNKSTRHGTRTHPRTQAVHVLTFSVLVSLAHSLASNILAAGVTAGAVAIIAAAAARYRRAVLVDRSRCDTILETCVRTSSRAHADRSVRDCVSQAGPGVPPPAALVVAVLAAVAAVAAFAGAGRAAGAAAFAFATLAAA